MPRPPQTPRRTDFSGEDLEAYDRIVGPDVPEDLDPDDYRAPDGPYGVLLNSPPFLAALWEQAALAVRAGEREGSFSHADREFVDVLVGFDWGYYGHLKLHIPNAIDVGVRLEAIEAIRHGREHELTDDERLLAEYIREVRDRRVTDDTYAAIEERLGRRGAIEYTVWITRLSLMLTLMMAFAIPTPALDEIDELLQSLKDDTPNATAAPRSTVRLKEVSICQ